MRNTEGSSHFPAEAKLGQVRAFLKVVTSQGGRTQVSKVARELHTDLVTLLPVMDAAEMLHLATVEKGEVKLTDTAEEFSATGNADFSRLKPVLREIEPFKTAVSLKKFTAEQIASELARQGIRWHHEDTVNTSVLREILIHWGLPSGLFNYDGFVATFTAIPMS